MICFIQFKTCTNKPKGGVKANQVFLIPKPVDFPSNVTKIRAPVGRWKDGLFDCFKLGYFHPQVWLSLCCTECESFWLKTVFIPIFIDFMDSITRCFGTSYAKDATKLLRLVTWWLLTSSHLQDRFCNRTTSYNLRLFIWCIRILFRWWP